MGYSTSDCLPDVHSLGQSSGWALNIIY